LRSIPSANALDFDHVRTAEPAMDRSVQIAAAQYQPPESRADERSTMLRIGLGLGLVYMVFLACWIWATRLRSRQPPH
jgi:hypothetical protein